jgi:hypothetical protein
MRPFVCICCGEPMSARGNALSRNPNMCASCSSLADGIEENDVAVPRAQGPEDSLKGLGLTPKEPATPGQSGEFAAAN